MEPVTVARHAMATRFEALLYGENAVALRAAAEEALQEIERLERKLSLYRPDSEISRVNARAAREAVRVEPEVFRLLEWAKTLSVETDGAFDISVAPLLRCWGFVCGRGKFPEAPELERARRQVGMRRVRLDPENFTVQFEEEGMMLDLGAIGKGYAVECAAEILREAGVERALLHGGLSTIYGLGAPPDAPGWKVGIPGGGGSELTGSLDQHGVTENTEKKRPTEAELDFVALAPLRDQALSVSASWGKSFTHEGREYGHLLDPRTGQPAEQGLLAAVICPSATETDALSTALLIAGPAGLAHLRRIRPGIASLVIAPAPGANPPWRVFSEGIALR